MKKVQGIIPGGPIGISHLQNVHDSELKEGKRTLPSMHRFNILAEETRMRHLGVRVPSLFFVLN